MHLYINTLRPRQNGRRFPDDIFKCIFLNENAWISLKISLKFIPKVRIDNIPALVQIMAWRRAGEKPLSEPMMVSLPTHICVTRPQWVKRVFGKKLWIWMNNNLLVHSIFAIEMQSSVNTYAWMYSTLLWKNTHTSECQLFHIYFRRLTTHI